MRFLNLLERIWRTLMTLFCFGLFGVGGLLLSLIWFNLLFVVYRDKTVRIRVARRSVNHSFRLFLFVAKMLGALTYNVEGLDKLRQDKGCLILANHPTLLDYVLIASIMPDVDCLVKAGLLRNPFLSGVIRACHYLPNNQHDVLLKECYSRLGQGDNLLIFPAGTRSIQGVNSSFQRGAANIALRCKCPIRFIHIYSSEAALTKQSKWYEIPKRKLKFTVVVGECLRADELIHLTDEQPPSLQARYLTHEFETRLI